jgi:CheY-like chemotaxis protein
MAFTVVLGLVSIRWMGSLADTTRNILEHPFKVSVAIATIKSEILTNQIALMRIAGSQDPEAIRELSMSIADHRAKVDQKITVLRQSYLGPQSDIDFLVRDLGRYRQSGDRVMELVREGRRGEAATLVQEHSTPLQVAAMGDVEQIIDFAANRATLFQQEASRKAAAAVRTTVALLAVIVALKMLMALLLTRSIGASLRTASRTVADLLAGSRAKLQATEAVAAGDLEQEIPVTEPLRLDPERLPNDDLGRLMGAIAGLSAVQASQDGSFRRMTAALRQAREDECRLQWHKTGLGELDRLMRGEQDLGSLAGKVLDFLAGYLGAGAGALYLHRETDLELLAAHAPSSRKGPLERLRVGEGLIGQAAREGRLRTLAPVPADYLVIESALGSAAPAMVAAVPLVHDRQLVGALELATFQPFDGTALEFLTRAAEVLAVGLQVNLARRKVDELLAQSQCQEEELRVQQEELQSTNAELEERAHELESQREQIRAKGLEVERVSSYKSQFLANMSHELRTPLNSLMILSGLLEENKDGNLTPKQVEYAATIRTAGNDLLELINDILDLSKIEAGRLEYQLDDSFPRDILERLQASFQPQAEQKGLAYSQALEAGCPGVIRTDVHRCQQILRNLVSNAIKFTGQGAVSVRAYAPAAGENPLGVPAIAFQVRDTGIGIPADKHELVFLAFQQADGSTSRKYGGTGLGLAISRQLARGLGGDLRLESAPGAGTVVTLYLPLAHAVRPVPAPAPASGFVPFAQPALQARPEPPCPAPLADDRELAEARRGSILIIEDDRAFAAVLLDLVRERGFKGLVAGDGPGGLLLAESSQPSAIILDVGLPGMDGWEVMRRLADTPRTRHIPVHFLSGQDGRQRALAMGAIGFVAKPAAREQLDAVLGSIEAALAHGVKRLLIVEDDPDEAVRLQALLQGRDIEIQVAAGGTEAIRLLAAEPYDCIVLDVGHSGRSAFDLLDHLRALDEPLRLPVIVHSAGELSPEDSARLQRYAGSMVIKGAPDPGRLLQEVTLFLHALEASLPPRQQRTIRSTLGGDAAFQDRKVLLVDDDMRNLFSLSSLLAERGIAILEAENGREALAQLDAHPDIDLVLMDIMMPEMDGYQAMRAIRRDRRFTHLPVIAFTAKAMQSDREACLQAGASDYLAKPIDQERLLSLLRVWLYQPVG